MMGRGGDLVRHRGENNEEQYEKGETLSRDDWCIIPKQRTGSLDGKIVYITYWKTGESYECDKTSTENVEDINSRSREGCRMKTTECTPKMLRKAVSIRCSFRGDSVCEHSPPTNALTRDVIV